MSVTWNYDRTTTWFDMCKACSWLKILTRSPSTQQSLYCYCDSRTFGTFNMSKGPNDYWKKQPPPPSFLTLVSLTIKISRKSFCFSSLSDPLLQWGRRAGVSRPQTLTPETAQHLKYPTQWQTTSHPLYFLPAEPKFIKTQKPGKKSSVTFVFTRCCALNWLFFWTLLNVEAFFLSLDTFFLSIWSVSQHSKIR